MIDICPMHTDESVTGAFLNGEFGYGFECTRNGHPGGGLYRWSRVPEQPGFERLGGVADELGLATELSAVLAKHKRQWIEYGVVERGYALAKPEDWAFLVQKYGHTAVEPKRYTASAFLAATLGRLSAGGAVAYHPGPASGRWDYLTSGISWWSLNPQTPWEDRLAWADSGSTVDYVPGQTEI